MPREAAVVSNNVRRDESVALIVLERICSTLDNKRFDPLQCLSAKTVAVLLYGCEETLFSYRKKKKAKYEHRLNARSGITQSGTPQNEADVRDDEVVEREMQQFASLDEYISNYSLFDVRKLGQNASVISGSSPRAEVKYIGSFITGEQILFSKFYSAVVFDGKTVSEKTPDQLEGGDTLVFQDLDYTQADDTNCKWRPFQLAFILMDINSIVSDTSQDRSIVDLIWFPTGGGKTEAYLGLTAFAIFYRRMAYPQKSNGTAVIMRYTLRLLAAQQFTRAATLICACENIRQDCAQRRHRYPAYPLGKEAITIGLWIGGSHIPNTNDEAKRHLDKLIEVSSYYYVRNEKERHNKFQVLKCPWCGTKMVKDDRDKKLVGEWGYSMSNKHFYMYCPHENCDFTKRLPIQIIDDELYDTPPTLLFATVDKFAMLPWDGRIGAFFGVDKNDRAPELIIQDELHLISGALGTIVGLYETAVDAICSQKDVAPKVIASTATIRRAKEQYSVLYNREIVQFPAPGLDAEDSFFARESVIDYPKGIYGRKYVGIMPSGKTKAMTAIRAMAALMQKLYTMELPDGVKDKLWTLTVYFNSLKDLGKASTMPIRLLDKIIHGLLRQSLSCYIRLHTCSLLN